MKTENDPVAFGDLYFKSFMSSPCTIVVTNREEGKILKVSNQILKDFGFGPDEITGKTLVETGIMKAGDFALLTEAIRQQGLFNNIQLKLKNRDGEERICLISGHQVTIGEKECIIQSLNDITDRHIMEEELLHGKYLETIGILAGGIANDFNGFLTSILGNISIAKLSLDNVEKIHRALSRAEEISIEAADLASKLLTFSEGGQPVFSEQSVISLIHNVREHHLKVGKVELELKSEPGLRSLWGDETQLNSLLTYILQNSLEAVTDREDGKIVIQLENTYVSWENRWTLKEGDYIKISIQDNGRGIPAENLDKVFVPYFTTKNNFTQRGIGLGLSICQNIVKNHNGHILIQSEPENGTTVLVYLPAFSEELVEAGLKDQSLVSGGGKILLLDDDQYVGEITDKLLMQIGYNVTIVREGVSAIKLYKSKMGTTDAFDVVILNLTNRLGMGGIETFEELKLLHPKIKAIASSGYIVDESIPDLLKIGFFDALKKPYSINRLSGVLGRAIRKKSQTVE